MFFVISLTEKKKQESIALASTKKAVQKINTDTNKIWGELAKIASDTNEKIPAEVTGSDKSKLSRVSKAEGNKFDKELLKALTKETGDLEKWFESASKSSQSPEVKTVVQNWLPTVRGMATEASKAEKEAAKAK